MNDDITTLTVPEAHELTRIPLPTLYRLIQQGEIPHIKIGRAVKIRRSSLERWIAAKEHAAAPQQTPTGAPE